MTEPCSPMERRLVLRLLQHWRGSGDVDHFPSLAAIDGSAIPDMWPHCAVLEIAGKETDPEFSYIGSALGASAGTELSGRKFSAAPADTLIARGLSYYGQVLIKKVPITFGGDFVDGRGTKILYRSIILPLSENGADIDRLLAGANCREVTEG